MESLLLPILLLSLLELFEAWWQRAKTLLEVLERGYGYYQKSIFLFFLMHPSFYYIFLVVLVTHVLNGWIITIFLFKSIDIFFKLTLMRSIFSEGKIDEGMSAVLSQRLAPWIFFVGAVLYPAMLYFALTG